MPDEQDTPTPEPSPDGANEGPEAQDEQSQSDTPGQADDSQGGDEPSEEEAAALAAAMAAINQVQGVADSATGAANPGDSNAQPYSAPELNGAASGGGQNQVDLLSDVHMDVRIELGRTRMYVEDVLKLGDGAVVELDKLAGDPVDVFVNDRRVARGEVLVLNDMFCVRINEIVDITQSDD